MRGGGVGIYFCMYMWMVGYVIKEVLFNYYIFFIVFPFILFMF